MDDHHRRVDRITKPDSGIGPCQWSPGGLVAQRGRGSALLTLERGGHRFDGRLRIANGFLVDRGPDACVDQPAERIGQRPVQGPLALIFVGTDQIETEVHAHWLRLIIQRPFVPRLSPGG